MKIYKTVDKDTIIFTFVPDGIADFFKNIKRQCHYGIYFKFNKIQNNNFSYNWFNFKRDFKKINKIINENEIIEIDLFYILDFVKNNVDFKSFPVYTTNEKINPVSVIINQLSTYSIRDYLIFKDIQKTILEDEKKRYMEELSDRNYILVQDKIVLKNELFKLTDNHKSIVYLGYIHFITSHHIFVIDNNLQFFIISYKDFKEMSIQLEEYEKIFLNKDMIDIQKRIKFYINETINAKLKRNEKRRLLKKEFYKLKNLLSIYTYLQNDKGDNYGNI